MTTVAIQGAAADATAETHGWEIRGPFDFERWAEGWAVHHTATHALLAVCTTPGECREYIDSGEAGAQFDRLLAHERGEHDGQRDASCRRC